MIEHTRRRVRGGRRYSSTDRAEARRLTATGADPTLSPEVLDAMVSPDGIRAVADVTFELESNRLGRPTTSGLLVDGEAVAPASGDTATLHNTRRVDVPVVFPGVTAGTLAPGVAVVEQTWVTARRVNLVEIHGADVPGQVTSATVSVARAPGVWTAVAGQASQGGRLAVPLDPPELATYGVRVSINATAGAPGDPVGIVEVDPMFVLDLSGEVAAVEVEWSREVDPGTTADPVGNYEASRVSIELDDTSGQWNPATNALLDVGHRIEVALGIAHTIGGAPVEELFPAGVFYSEPFDTASDSTTVTITGTDRLGRNAETAVSEEVYVDSTIEACVRDLAGTYLDLGADQVVVDASVGSLVFPYLYSSGDLGSFLADIAKATGCTVHVDALDRLVLARRSSTTTGPVAVVTEETSLLGYRRPPGYDVTTSIVTATASPLTLGAISDLWGMPPGGIVVPAGATHDLVAVYESLPGLNGYVTGIVADGAYTVTAAAYYANRAEVSIRNDEARPLAIADLRIRGNPLEESSLTARVEHAPSVLRYGPRQLDVECRLAQTQQQTELVAAIVLDAFRSLDDEGVRRLPDLALDALGLLHVEAGDRITVAYPDQGVGGDFTVLARRLAYSEGAILSNDVRVRETPSDVAYLTLDVGLLLDDGVLVGY